DLRWLRPDGKTQVSVVYEGGRPVGVSKLVVSTQHSDKIDNAELREGVIALVVRPVLADVAFDVVDRDVLINPTGRFVVGGPQGDAGLDRKSTRLNSSHVSISYAVFCLKKKKTQSARRDKPRPE